MASFKSGRQPWGSLPLCLPGEGREPQTLFIFYAWREKPVPKGARWVGMMPCMAATA